MKDLRIIAKSLIVMRLQKIISSSQILVGLFLLLPSCQHTGSGSIADTNPVRVSKQALIDDIREYLGIVDEVHVYLLVSQRTFSAGVVFAAIFQDSKLGTVVGSETGGRIGFNSDPIDIKLTHTGLLAKVPTAILVMPGVDRDRGLLPDISVQPTVDQLQQGEDPGMIQVLQDINSPLKK